MSSEEPKDRRTFVQTFEGLFNRAFKDQITPQLKSALREIGVNLDAPLAPQYPAQAFHDSLRVIAHVVFPDRPLPEAYREMGKRFVEGYFKTLAGRTVLPLLKLVGPLQSLKRLTASLRTGNNYSEARILSTAERDVTVWVNDCFAEDPNFAAGIMERGIELVGARHPRAVVTSREKMPEVTLRVTWDA